MEQQSSGIQQHAVIWIQGCVNLHQSQDEFGLDPWIGCHSGKLDILQSQCLLLVKSDWQPSCAQTHQHLWWEFFTDHISSFNSTSCSCPSQLFLPAFWWRQTVITSSVFALCWWLMYEEGRGIFNGFAWRAATTSHLVSWPTSAKEDPGSFFWAIAKTESNCQCLPPWPSQDREEESSFFFSLWLWLAEC